MGRFILSNRVIAFVNGTEHRGQFVFTTYEYDNLKLFYYRGLKEWSNEKGYLTDTCLTAQDKYKAYLDYFRIAYER